MKTNTDIVNKIDETVERIIFISTNRLAEVCKMMRGKEFFSKQYLWITYNMNMPRDDLYLDR